MNVRKQSFSIERHCQLVGGAVTLSGVHLLLPDGEPELVKKTCARFSECYKNEAGEEPTGNVVPFAGCLLGEPGI